MKRAALPLDLHRPSDGRRERGGGGSRRQGRKGPIACPAHPTQGWPQPRVSPRPDPHTHPRGAHAPAALIAGPPGGAASRAEEARGGGRRGMPGSRPVSKLDSPFPHPSRHAGSTTRAPTPPSSPAWGGGASRSSGHRDRDSGAGRWPGWAPRRGKFGRGKVPVAPPGRGAGWARFGCCPGARAAPRRAAPHPPLPGPCALPARSLPRRRSVVFPRAPRALTSGSGRAEPWSTPWDASKRQDPGQVRLRRPLGGAEGEREREGETRRRVRACVEERESEGVCVSD